VYKDFYFNLKGELQGKERPKAEDNPFLPSAKDRAYVKGCMVKVIEPGKFVNWISPPARGINGKAIDFEYVKFH
jgi:benzoyl-CoA 2,3-dioxygenase component B